MLPWCDNKIAIDSREPEKPFENAKSFYDIGAAPGRNAIKIKPSDHFSAIIPQFCT